jgi:hypothetical protein
LNAYFKGSVDDASLSFLSDIFRFSGIPLFLKTYLLVVTTVSFSPTIFGSTGGLTAKG